MRARPGIRLPVLLLKAPVLVYRLTLSAFLGHSCRFYPTCSAYALEALDTHGAWTGTRLAVRRLLRCHPWGGSGVDPVPPAGTHADQQGAP